MILLIDNYDSFVYNLARYVGELGYKRVVTRNNSITIKEIRAMNPSHIILSPGPCTPNEAGISLEVIKCFGEKIPILGVCLGHQCIGQAYGGRVTRAERPMHGKSSLVTHNNKNIFKNMITNPLKVARYHSLIVSNEGFPECLEINAWSEEGEIMALSHKTFPVVGVQFHPESVLTKQGHSLLENFIKT